MNSLITKKYLPYQKIAESTDQNHRNLVVPYIMTKNEPVLAFNNSIRRIIVSNNKIEN